MRVCVRACGRVCVCMYVRMWGRCGEKEDCNIIQPNIKNESKKVTQDCERGERWGAARKGRGGGGGGGVGEGAGAGAGARRAGRERQRENGGDKGKKRRRDMKIGKAGNETWTVLHKHREKHLSIIIIILEATHVQIN